MSFDKNNFSFTEKFPQKNLAQGHGERVLLVHVYFTNEKIAENLEEFKELAVSAGAQITDVITSTRRVPESKYFVGEGKAQEIRESVLLNKIQLVIFDHTLTPAQERNLEKLIKCRVIDRTELILDIFAQRARSFEGKLQVELAQLRHLSTRLVRGWLHLERQRGGIGLRGPGETQLETDRRLIRSKIKLISKRLTKIRKQRELRRKSRRKATIPTVAIVGYTNAGKSTLFNTLTGSSVFVANQLFATLDPTLRRIDFPEMGPIILADTVGFIRHLPHDLIEAFKATLEEVSEADLLLHIVDAFESERHEHIREVNSVLEDIDAEKVPRILVYNKIDNNSEIHPKIERDENGQIHRVFISALTKEGIHGLISAIGEMLGKNMIEETVLLSPREAKLRAMLYERSFVLEEKIDEAGNFNLLIRLPKSEFEKLFRV